MRTIEQAIELAGKNPYMCYGAVKEGFMFHIVFMPNDGWFHVTMLFSPGYPGTDGAGGKTKETLMESIDSLIADAKRIYVNGGGYNEDDEW